MATTIRLSDPTPLFTGYLGRGIPSKYLELPQGSEVNYSRRALNALQDYLPFIETSHRVWVVREGLEYSRVRSTLSLRKPFDHQTYYRKAVYKVPSGSWACTGDGDYYADDGFGNLTHLEPGSFHQDLGLNQYGTSKRIEDCVVGMVYFFL